MIFTKSRYSSVVLTFDIPTHHYVVIYRLLISIDFHSYLMTSDISHPQIALVIDRQTVRHVEHILAVLFQDLQFEV